MADLGLANYKNRFYSPTLGRFLQNDPIRFDGGDLNLYRYCGNNVINATDPDGQVAFLVPIAIFAAKMAIGHFADKALDHAQQNLVPEEHRETVGKIRTGVDVVRAATGDLKSITKLGAKTGKKAAAKSGGESAAAATGRRAHGNYGTALGDKYDTKVTLPSGKKPDAVDWANHEVRELKPDNARAIRRGERQVEGYRKELEQVTGQPWTSEVDTYRP